MKEFVVVLLVVVAFFTLLFYGLTSLASAKCYSMWSETFKPQWGYLTECTIEVNGIRIPAQNYRVL